MSEKYTSKEKPNILTDAAIMVGVFVLAGAAVEFVAD